MGEKRFASGLIKSITITLMGLFFMVFLAKPLFSDFSKSLVLEDSQEVDVAKKEILQILSDKGYFDISFENCRIKFSKGFGRKCLTNDPDDPLFLVGTGAIEVTYSIRFEDLQLGEKKSDVGSAYNLGVRHTNESQIHSQELKNIYLFRLGDVLGLNGDYEKVQEILHEGYIYFQSHKKNLSWRKITSCYGDTYEFSKGAFIDEISVSQKVLLNNNLNILVRTKGCN